MHSLKDDVVKDAIEKISKEVKCPDAAIVLGSGVSAFEDLHNAKSFEYADLLGIAPTVHGHKGSLTIGAINESEDSPTIAVFRGRFHMYEGHDWNTVTLLAKLVVGLEIPNFIITNAAGGLNKDFQVGDLMVIESFRDHLNPNLKETGLLQAIASKPHDSVNSLTKMILELGAQLTKEDSEFRALKRGCYAALLGPSYETFAEVEMLRRLKADAVGMSTAPELVTAKDTKTKACGISVITNVWNEEVTMGGHEEVLQESKLASIRLNKLLTKFLTNLK